MIYVSNLERIGFIFVVRNMVLQTCHKILYKCDMLYNGKCYNAIICMYNNGKPRTLYEVLGKDKAEAKEILLFVRKLLVRYTTANTNGLKGIAHAEWKWLKCSIRIQIRYSKPSLRWVHPKEFTCLWFRYARN